MPKVLVTIDVEVGELALDMQDSFKTFIEGKVDGKEVGYSLILSLLDTYGVKGEFFVDVYPYKKFGDKNFLKLCQNIKSKGHYVQLHTHPDGSYDRHRRYMHEYSLEEQIEIIEAGKEKIREYTGKDPAAHRAGGYGINSDTIKALEYAGILCDASYFYGNQACLMESQTINKPFKIENVIEIPVTVYKKNVNTPLFGINALDRNYFQKMDIRYGSNKEDIINILLKSSCDQVIVLFLHSFNFLNRRYDFKKNRFKRVSVNHDMINSFDMLLRDISLMQNCTFISINELLSYNFQDEQDYLWEVVETQSILKRVNRKLSKVLGITNNC